MTFLFQLISILFQLMRLIIQWTLCSTVRLIIQWTLWSEKYGKRYTLQIWKKIWADILWCCVMSAQIPKMLQISSFKKKKSLDCLHANLNVKFGIVGVLNFWQWERKMLEWANWLLKDVPTMLQLWPCPLILQFLSCV